MEAFQDFGQFHGTSEAELLAWLRQLLRHRLANFTRRYRGTRKRGGAREVALPTGASSTDQQGELPADTPSPSVQAMAREHDQGFKQALERLPDDYRQVITLRYLEELPFEAIGQRMNRSANAARLLWLRAIERLQQVWETAP